MREVLCLIFGSVILIANAIDVTWTVLGTHGGGPISGPVLSFAWKSAVALHRRRHHHRALSFAGSALLVLLLLLWIGLLWLGWLMLFSADRNALISTQSHVPASLAGRVYFTGYSLATLGNGDYMPSSKLWQVLTAIMAFSGLATLSMAITFLLNILPAVVQQRTLAAYISDMGGKAPAILARAWSGEAFVALGDQLVQITPMIHLYTEQHLAYPVLHFFHSETERTSIALRLASLFDMIFLLAEGAAPEGRLPPLIIDPVRAALRGLSSVAQEEFVDPRDAAPAPNLAILRDLGIPTIDDESYARTAAEHVKARRFFAGLVFDDGWDWDKVR